MREHLAEGGVVVHHEVGRPARVEPVVGGLQWTVIAIVVLVFCVLVLVRVRSLRRGAAADRSSDAG